MVCQFDKIKYDGLILFVIYYRVDFKDKEIFQRYERKKEEWVFFEEFFNSNLVFREDFVDFCGVFKVFMFYFVSDLFKSFEFMQFEIMKKEDFKSWEVLLRK